MATVNACTNSLSGTTGTGNYVGANTPTLITPVLGAATATTINGLQITPSTNGTLSLANSSSLITSGAHNITLTCTADTNVTLPVSGTLATTANTGLATAWANIANPAGTASIVGQYNVASVNRTAQGVVAVTLTNALSSTNYSAVATVSDGTHKIASLVNTSTSVITVSIGDGAGAPFDANFNLIVMGT